MSAVLATVLTAILLGLGASSAQAQRRVQLVNFDSNWRYFTNGTDLPTQSANMWKSRTYAAENTWPSGMGLLGVETTPAVYPYPFNTTFAAYDNNIITYYLRGHFNLAASDMVWPLTLVVSNLCDDGCAAYLNSNGVASIRVPFNSGFTAPATGGPTEGAYETPVTLSYPTAAAINNALFVGDNVVAAEVKQNATGSSDIVFGLSLTAIVPTTLTITSQPPSQVPATIGSPFTISAGVSGGPGLYQWQSSPNGATWANVAGAGSPNPTNGVLSYSATPSSSSVTLYRLVVSNGVSTVISGTSTVTVTADTSGPYMVSAEVLEEATRTNRIRIIWSERLLSLPNGGPVCAGCGTNFTVVFAASNLTVTVSNVLYNPSGGPNAEPVTILTMSTTNWHIGTNYYVIANRIRDAQNNVVAPNSVIGVGWPSSVNTNVMDFNATWETHTDWALFDPTIYQQPWNSVDYNTATNGNWGSGGFGVYWKDNAINPGYVPCRGMLGSELSSYVRNPTLFRSTFVVPANLATGVTLRVTAVYDDGYILYLNGTELPSPIGRVNVPAGTLPDENTRSIGEAIDALCVSNNVMVTLRPGTNVVAAAVVQFNTEGANGGDTFWGLRLDVSRTTYRTSPVPTNGVPTNQVRVTATRLPNRNVTFTWPTNIYGYALEFTTNITRVGQNTVLGPWYQAQTNMAIGMVTNYPVPISGSGPAYIFRLHKVP